MTLDRFQGCLLGLSLGDAMGAPHEGGILERFLWRLIGRTRDSRMRWTDDTQMSIDVTESLLAQGRLDPDDLALRFAASYQWSRGYGPGAAKLLKRIRRGIDWRKANRSVYPDGSYGNGGAMRAPVLGLFYGNRQDELFDATRLSAEITHAHPLGIEGAVLMAFATASAVNGGDSMQILRNGTDRCALEPFTSRLAIAEAWLKSNGEISASDVARKLGNGIAATQSCVTALYLALRFRDQSFVSLQQFIAAGGGDVDTIGAMAGAIWGAVNGAANLPMDLLESLEQREKLVMLAAALHRASHEPPNWR